MNDPADSRLAARLLHNTFLRTLDPATVRRLKDALDEARTFNDLPPELADLVSRARIEYQAHRA